MKVDVVLPLFQPGETWLREAVDSVRAQTHRDWSLFLIDDASDDRRTERMAGEYADADDRIRFLRTRRRLGPGQARMFALARGEGQAIAFIDQDDRWKPRKLEAQITRLAAEPTTHAVLTGVDHIDDSGRIIGREGSGGATDSPRWDSAGTEASRLKRLVFLRHDGIHLVSALIRRDAFDAVGGFWPGLQSGEDSEFWVRFVGAGYRFVRVPHALIERRVHAGNTSRSASWRAGHWEALEKILREHPDLTPVEGARRRNLLCEEAMNQLMAGEGPACRRTAARMLRLSAFDYRGWALLGLSFVPSLGATVVEPRLR